MDTAVIAPLAAPEFKAGAGPAAAAAAAGPAGAGPAAAAAAAGPAVAAQATLAASTAAFQEQVQHALQRELAAVQATFGDMMKQAGAALAATDFRTR